MDGSPSRALSSRIAAADPDDADGLGAHAAGLRSLRETLQQDDAYELADQLDVAIQLTELLAEGDGFGPEKLLALVSDTVARVEGALAYRTELDTRPAEPQEDEPLPPRLELDLAPAPFPSSGSGLRLDDGASSWSSESPAMRTQNEKLFGEILVQLGTITQDVLERGLLAQRGTGRRIGEVLVELGAITWEQVARAADIQEKLRKTAKRS